MPLTDDLYRDIILDHFKNPRHRGAVEDPDISVQGTNPFCGDEMELTMRLDGERIAQIKILAKGCSISQSSASMMSEVLTGRTLRDAEGYTQAFKQMMLGRGTAADLPDGLEDIEALEGVKKYPVRIKCALLAWNTFLEGLKAHAGSPRRKVAVTHQEE